MAKKAIDTNHKAQIGISWLQWLIEGLWACGVEIVSAHNDDSLDVLILLKRRKEKKSYAGPTGDVIFAQVKTGYRRNRPLQTDADYKLTLGKKHLAAHRPRWLSFPGPVIMIHVFPPDVTNSTPKAFWCDLRNPDAFPVGAASVKIETKHALEGSQGKSALFNLCWRWAELRALPVVNAPAAVQWSTHHPGKATSGLLTFRNLSKAFYRDLVSEAKISPSRFGDVRVTNRGWRHMTRRSRPAMRVMQSMLLLPAASAILEAQLNPEKLTSVTEHLRPSGLLRRRCYEALTARVVFAERQEGVVRVILEHTETVFPNGTAQIERTLYSVYEIARARKTV